MFRNEFKSAVFILVLIVSLNTKVVASPYFCFKAMTYNILYTGFAHSSFAWELRRPLVIELLNSASPDILGLQEDGTEQRDDIADSLSEYSKVDTTIGNFAHISIFYKKSVFSLVDSGQFRVNNNNGRKGTWAKLQENKTGTIVFVTNGHFLAGSHTNLPQRRIDAAVDFATKIALYNTENSPIVMLGDLNGRFSDIYI